MAGQRTVTAQINRPDGSAWGGAVVRFKPSEDSFTQTPDASYPIDTITAVADSTGALQVTLASGLSTTYVVTMPDDESYTIIVEDGSDVSLEDLRAATEGAAIPEASIESIIAGFMASYVGQGIIVQEDDTTKVSVLGVIDFRTGLNVTESPTGEANVVVDVGTASTQVAAGDHLHDSRYYTESEVDALIAAVPTVTRINGSSGAAGTDRTLQKLSADASTNSTTTLATVMTTTGVGAGVWHARFLIRHQSAATTTGVKFRVNHGGTVTWMVVQSQYVDASAGGVSGLGATQNSPTAAGTMGAFVARANNTTLGPTLSVDTANADMLTVIEALFEISVSGSLTLDHASEVAAASTVKSGTSLMLTKIG